MIMVPKTSEMNYHLTFQRFSRRFSFAPLQRAEEQRKDRPEFQQEDGYHRFETPNIWMVYLQGENQMSMGLHTHLNNQ